MDGKFGVKVQGLKEDANVLNSKDRELYFSLCGWGCDFIIVMNSSKIIQENE